MVVDSEEREIVAGERAGAGAYEVVWVRDITERDRSRSWMIACNASSSIRQRICSRSYGDVRNGLITTLCVSGQGVFEGDDQGWDGSYRDAARWI